MGLYENRRKLLTGPINPSDPVCVPKFRRLPRYDHKRKKIKDQKILEILFDFGMHIKYGYDFPSEYNVHNIDEDWKAAWLVGQSLIIKFKIDGNFAILSNIGTHKEVYGPTRRFK